MIILIGMVYSCVDTPDKRVFPREKFERSVIIPKVELTISGRDTLHNNYVLGDIADILVDRNGNIYVADKISLQLFKFDSAGTFRRAIGTRGRGKGEFMDISHTTLINRPDKNSSILVLDEVNSRITEFSLEGHIMNTFNRPINSEFPSGPFQLVKDQQDERLLFLYKLTDQSEDGDCLLHVFDKHVQTKLRCFGNYNDLNYARANVFNYLTQARSGYFTFSDGKNIYYVPKLYSGKIYKYHYSLNKERLEGEDTALSGYVFEKRPFQENGEPRDYRISYQGRQYFGQFVNLSMGLYEHSGILYHFSVIRHDNESQFGVEVYALDGTLKAYHRINSIENPGENVSYQVLEMDNRGYFYFLNSREGNTIYKVRLPI